MTICPDDPHVHYHGNTIVPGAWIVHVDRRPVAACLADETARRIAALLDEHGLYEIPDHLPDALVWGPPLTEPIIDWRLPTNPTPEGHR